MFDIRNKGVMVWVANKRMGVMNVYTVSVVMIVFLMLCEIAVVVFWINDLLGVLGGCNGGISVIASVDRAESWNDRFVVARFGFVNIRMDTDRRSILIGFG